LQAIIGYDERRGTILIRDPYNRSLCEGLVPEMLEHYRATGPRGMLMVPNEKADLLAGIDLKDALLLVLAQTDGQELSDRIRASERAIQLSPCFVEAHDLRARLLIKAKRYAEARRACRPEFFGATPPPELQCTEALDEAEYGDTRAAVRKLEALVEVEPHYFQAWNLLADWYRNFPDAVKYLRAAKEMARLEPHRPIPLGYLAEAQMMNDARAEAKATLRRAMTLDPTYEFAGATLFDLQLQDYELSQAEETLNILRHQIGGNSALICELKLADKRKDSDQAQKLFRKLCLSSTADVAQIHEAMEADMEIDWNVIVDKVLAGVVDLPNANPNLRAIVSDRYVKRGEWDRLGSISPIIAKSCGRMTRPGDISDTSSIPILIERPRMSGSLIGAAAAISKAGCCGIWPRRFAN
jgi:Tfp pilus assembly protein PilF